MNSDDHITRALHQQADEIQTGPLTMSDIKGKARSIQRRRTLATVAGAAAVVAIIAPIGVIAMNNGDKNTNLPIATNGGTPTKTSGAAPVYTVDLTPPAEGTYGGEVGVPMWMQGSISDVHGATTDVGMPVRNFVQDTNGNWAGMTSDNGSWSWTSFGNSGGVEASEQSDNDRVAVTPDGQSFAWISKFAPDDASPKQWQLTLAGPHAKTWNLDLQDNSGAFVVGILPDWSVVYAIGGDKVMIAHQDDTITRLGGHAISARSVSTATGLIAAQTSYNDDGTSCWALMDASGDSKAETCDYALGQFNADGSRIVGQDSGADGLPGRLYQLDASDLEPLATFKAPDGAGFWSDTAWNGNTLLALIYDYPSQTWNISFLSTDGVLLARSAGKTGDEFDPPYLFGAGPLNAIAP